LGYFGGALVVRPPEALSQSRHQAPEVSGPSVPLALGFYKCVLGATHRDQVEGDHAASLLCHPIDFRIEPIEVFKVVNHSVANLEYRIAPSTVTSGHNPIVVRGHHDVQHVADLKCPHIQRTNGDRFLRHKRFRSTLCLRITSPERLIHKEETTMLQMAAELSGQHKRITHWQRSSAEDLKHHPT
jgi:hypothetical protein